MVKPLFGVERTLHLGASFSKLDPLPLAKQPWSFSSKYLLNPLNSKEMLVESIELRGIQLYRQVHTPQQ